jgi:hypothetical protein
LESSGGQAVSRLSGDHVRMHTIAKSTQVIIAMSELTVASKSSCEPTVKST